MATLLVLSMYGAVAGIAFVRGSAARSTKNIHAERWMLVVSLVAIVLALSNQMDLIPDAIAFAKSLGKEHGWYAYRWPMAMLIVQICGVVAVLAFIRYWRLFRQLRWRDWLAVCGVVLLASYYLLRGTSLHWVDPWFGFHLGCPRSNPWIELVSVSLIGAGLWLGRNKQLVSIDTRRNRADTKSQPSKA